MYSRIFDLLSYVNIQNQVIKLKIKNYNIVILYIIISFYK